MKWNGQLVAYTPVVHSFTFLSKEKDARPVLKWVWTYCKLVVEVPLLEDISQSALQIDMLDPNTRGSNSFLG